MNNRERFKQNYDCLIVKETALKILTDSATFSTGIAIIFESLTATPPTILTVCLKYL